MRYKSRLDPVPWMFAVQSLSSSLLRKAIEHFSFPTLQQRSMSPSIVILTGLLCASAALAHPRPVINRDLVPSNLAVTWYQAPLTFSESPSTSTDASCGWSVSTGQLNTTECYILHTDALGLQQDELHECVLKVWNGVSDCSGDGSWTSYAVPSGKGTTCVETGVLDGGNFQHKSCVLTCS